MSRLRKSLLLACLTLATALPAGAAEEKPAGPPPVRRDRHGDPLPAGARLRLGAGRFRTTSRLGFDLSPDGKVLVANERRWIRLVDAGTGQEIRRLPRPGTWIGRLRFTGDGRLLLGWAGNGLVVFLDPANGKELRRFREPVDEKLGGGSEAAWARDGTVLVTAHQKSVTRHDKDVFDHSPFVVNVWDTVRSRRRARLQVLPDLDLSAALSADGKTLATWGLQWSRRRGGFDQVLQVWDVSSGKELRRAALDRSRRHGRGAFSPDGKVLALAGAAEVTLWDAAAGKERPLAAAGGNVRQLAFSQGGKLLGAATEAGVVHVWEAAAGKRRAEWQAPRGLSVTVTFSPAGKALAWGMAGQAFCQWEVASGKALTPLEGHLHGVTALAFSPGGTTVLSADAGGTLCRWDAATGRLLGRTRLDLGKPRGRPSPWDFDHRLALAADGSRLAAWDHAGGLLRVWETSGGKRVRDLAGRRSGSGLPPALSADGRWLACPGADGVLLWDLSRGRKVGPWHFPALHPRAAALSPEGGRLAAAGTGEDGREALVVLDAGTGKAVCRFGVGDLLVDRLTFSPDGGILAAGDRHGRVRLFDAATGRERAALGSRADHTEQVDAELVFSPDGRMLALARRRDPSGPALVQVWETAGGGLRCQFAGQRGIVRALAFAPGGRSLAAGGSATTVLVWDLARPPGAEQGSGRPSAARQESLWRDLASADAARGYRAVLALAADPDAAGALIEKKLRAAAGAVPAARRVDRLVEELDSDDFPVRQRAEAELRRLGRGCVPALDRALRSNPSLEVRRRASRLLAELCRPGANPEELRRLRAVEVLERVATPAARRTLQRLAGGHPDADLTRECRAALRRLARSPDTAR
jgi:WD40 repeat protein